MPNNVGPTDRLIRLILGFGILSLWFFLPGAWKYVAFLGLIPLFTAVVGYCMLYKVMGFSTCPAKR